MAGKSKLARRLSYIKKRETTNTKNAPAQKTSPQPSHQVDTKQLASAISGIPGWQPVGRYTFRKIEDFQIHKKVPGTGKTPDTLLISPATDWKKIFWDIETTGLSSSAGNRIILFGFGYYIHPQNSNSAHPNTFRVEQYFLVDYPGEGEFLQNIYAAFTYPEAVYISYNGKGFDSHMLVERMLMNGIRWNLPFQYDLLHTARRLYRKTLPSCSLSSIENEILNIKRKNDIPGSEIPAEYNRFLETGNIGRLPDMFSHNTQDILTLECLYRHAATLLISPKKRTGLEDPVGMAFLLFKTNRTNSAVIELENGYFRKGNQQAGKYVSAYYKRNGMWNKAEHLWQDMCKKSLSVFGRVELAKYYEHRLKKCKKAHLLVTEALAIPCLDDAMRESLRYRKKRLERKLSDKTESAQYSASNPPINGNTL